MSLFEFTFALSAVVMGLALAHLASVLHKLLLAGRRVAWSPEPILLASIVTLVIIAVWLQSWSLRNETSVSVGRTILEVLKLLTLYIAAASCLPEPATREERVDTYEYYDRTRRLSFGALILSYFLFQAGDLVAEGLPDRIALWTLLEWFLYPLLYGTLLFIRARWFNILTLSFALLFYGWLVIGMRVSE